MPADSEKESVIVTDPDILGGSYPVFRGTRVPFDNLLEHLREGGTIDDFLIEFPTVTRDQAMAALEYASESVRLRQAS
jgi:uncharacterized protein (DUF433 family)